jgi:hypothetical protein
MGHGSGGGDREAMGSRSHGDCALMAPVGWSLGSEYVRKVFDPRAKGLCSKPRAVILGVFKDIEHTVGQNLRH